MKTVSLDVLNLIITGLPSILIVEFVNGARKIFNSFKPYYNWNAFNTKKELNSCIFDKVLNLIITGLPSIQT